MIKSIFNKKMGQQIAGYKVEMCKIETNIKPMPLSNIRKGLNGQVDDGMAVKLNSKWGLLS